MKNNQLTRRDNEKVWNVINEIKSLYIKPKDPISIPFLGGWVLKQKNEGADDFNTKQSLIKRKWAFKYLEGKGIIKIKSFPTIKKDFEGDIFLIVKDKTKFDNYYKSCGKSYDEKSTEYKTSLKKEEKTKNNFNDKGKYEQDSTHGYLTVDGQQIKIGKISSRINKFIKFFWNGVYFGTDVIYDTVFPNIKTTKDANNLKFKIAETAIQERKNIIINTQKEVKKLLKLHNIKKYKFTANQRTCSVKLKVLKSDF